MFGANNRSGSGSVQTGAGLRRLRFFIASVQPIDYGVGFGDLNVPGLADGISYPRERHRHRFLPAARVHDQELVRPIFLAFAAILPPAVGNLNQAAPRGIKIRPAPHQMDCIRDADHLNAILRLAGAQANAEVGVLQNLRVDCRRDVLGGENQMHAERAPQPGDAD